MGWSTVAAGGTAAAGNPCTEAALQPDSAHLRDGDVEIVGEARFDGSVELNSRDASLEPCPEAITQLSHPAGARLHVVECHASCHGEAHDQGCWQGPGPQAILLATAPLQRFELDPITHHKSSDAFGAVDLVGTQADEIQPERIGAQRNVTEGLGCIAVERDCVRMTDLCQLQQRLLYADFIVCRHHAHQPGVGLDCLVQLVRRDQAVVIRLQQRHPATLLPQLGEGVQNGMVLRGDTDQMTRASTAMEPEPCMAEQGEVVGLRCSAGEHNTFGWNRKRVAKLTACQVHGSGSGQSSSVLAA